MRLFCRPLFVAVTFAAVPLVAHADDPQTMMHRYLMAHTEAMATARAAALNAIDSAEALEAYVEPRRAAMTDALGAWPPRTPLNARTTGTLERGGITIEKVLFESQPNHHVTALFYLPPGDGPHPAVLVPCGHARGGKAAEAYQRGSMLLAQQGIAALCFDPIEQGERIGLRREDGSPEFWGTEAHMAVGAGAILLGINTASYEIFDGIRAIDYLAARPEIDADRIGVAGNSGGGTQTAHIMALDPRVVAAAPSCYITSFPRLLDTIGAQDAEQNIFGQLAHGLDHGDFIILRAPKPTLICAATNDFFDIGGTWESFRDAKRVYTTLGYPERVDLAEANESHGWTQPLREATAHFMQRWLLGVDAPVRETEWAVLSDEEARATPTGEVMDLEGERSSFDLNREHLEELRAARDTAWEAMDEDARRATVRAVTDIGEAEAVAAARVLQNAPDWFPADELPAFTRITLESEVGIRIPTATRGPLDGETVTLVLPDSANGLGALAAHAGEGPAAVAFLRGLGPTQSARGSQAWANRFGSDWAEVFHAYLHGRSYVAMRAEDIYALLHWLRAQGAESVTIIAQGVAVVPALHAAALAPELIAGVTTVNPPPAWETIVAEPLGPLPYATLVHGALTLYDWPALVALVP